MYVVIPHDATVTCKDSHVLQCIFTVTVQKDKSQLTLAELREAKAKRDAMLRHSIQHTAVFAEQDGAEQ